MSFTLPELHYDYAALEPHIDAKTMEIHHSKHHNAYVTNLNNAIGGTAGEGKNIIELQEMMSHLPVAIRNNGGGHYNHSLFWELISPNGGGNPSGELAQAIDKDFGSFDEFKTAFANAATTRFGSGWAWLVYKDGKLAVCSTANQDNPLMDIPEANGGGGRPLMALDVWEHAYYLNYQNRRPDYISAFWNVIDWTEVAGKYRMASH